MPRMSKDGVNFYDVDNSDDSVEAAKSKGYREYLPMTKNGKDVFDVEASEDSYKAALAKGYKDVDAYNFTKDVGEIKKADSQFRGMIKGISQGHVDELGGALEAAGSAVGLRGVGSPNLMDIRLETDEEDKQSLGDVYRGMRDQRRELDKKAEKANPKAFFTGDVIGSAASTMRLPGANTLLGALGTGAVQGFGRSEADLTKPSLENVAQAAVDTTLGAAAGGAGYAVGKGIEAAAPYVAKGIGSAVGTVKDLTRGFTRGAKEAGEHVPDIMGVKDISVAVGGLKGAVKELKERGATAKEFSDVAAEARKTLNSQVMAGGQKIRPLQDLKAIGNGKALADFTDDEAVVSALLGEGDNPVKKWFATKAAVLHPGQVDADEYGRLLGLGSTTRNTAREFESKVAAKELKPVVEDVQNLFKDARNTRFNELQDAARQSFDTGAGDKTLFDVGTALEDATSLKSIPSSVKSTLDDVADMLFEGKGTSLQGLKKGDWGVVPPAEKFNRLQQARQLIDQQVNWAKREGLGQAENVLRGLRGNIDDALKVSPEKAEADALYKTAKELEAKFFGATEFRNPSGGIDIDEGKIARLMGGSDSANRFRATMEELRDYAKREDLPAEFRTKAADLLKRMDERLAVADTKRALGAFRYSNGPSSPAIERLQSASNGNTLLQDVIRSPAGFLNQADQFSKLLTSRLGKNFDQLSPTEKSGAVKFLLWTKKNPDASATTADQMFNKLLGIGAAK
jgi:hypothetical protein